MLRRLSLVAIVGLFVTLVATAARGRVGDAVQPQREQPVSSMPERLVEVRHHFIQVTLVHESVIRGDLPGVRTSAMELVRMPIPPGTPTMAVPFVDAISAAAERAAEATDLASAVSATAWMLRQCGECHQAVGVRPSPSAANRPDVGGLVGHMLEHQRAADELLQGLIIPSASESSRGAERLRVAPLQSGDLLPDPAFTGSLKRAGARVHQLAERAALASSPITRVAIYGELLMTCAECHSPHGKVWGPGQGYTRLAQ